MSYLKEIRFFLEDYSNVYPENPDIDIFKELGVVGDDFHEMIEKYSKNYNVDLSNYLWYFHTDEEGSFSFGELFYDPPYKKVERIPVTPKMLAEFINVGKWDIKYPEHEINKRRYDLIINNVILILFIISLIIWGLSKII